MKLAPGITLTHLLFVDDILLFCNGTRRYIECLERGINLFKTATGMLIKIQKSTLTPYLLRELEVRILTIFSQFFPAPVSDLQDGLKYLGFHLNPNDYRKLDWKWLIGKLEKRLQSWSNKWLSRAGRLKKTSLVMLSWNKDPSPR